MAFHELKDIEPEQQRHRNHGEFRQPSSAGEPGPVLQPNPGDSGSGREPPSSRSLPISQSDPKNGKSSPVAGSLCPLSR